MAMDSLEDDTPFYRPVKPLPFELAQHAGIFFEEKLCLYPSTSLLEQS